MQTLNERDFLARRREARLSYAIYLKSKESQDECYDMVAAGLQQPAHVLQHIPPENFMTATRQRALDGVDQLALAYSAGHALDELRAAYSTILAYWLAFARYDMAFDAQADEAEQGFPHFALPGDGYEQINRMVCLGILLGCGSLLPRLAPVIDFNNHEKDGLLERLLACFVAGRDATWPKCTRHLPYVNTLKIFAAEKDARPALMQLICSNGMQPAAASPITTATGATPRSGATGPGKRPPSPACSISMTAAIAARPSIRPTSWRSAG